MTERPRPTPPPGYSEGDELSVSQVEKFAACEARWWFRYVAKIKEPETAATQLGDAVHKLIEAYLDLGQLVPGSLIHGDYPARLAHALLLSAPAYWDDDGWLGHSEGVVKTERPITWISPSGVWFHGFVDIVEEDVSGTTVRDWKTCASFKYMKTLHKDPQAVLYGEALQADRMVWHYVQTKGPGKQQWPEGDEPPTKQATWDRATKPADPEVLISLDRLGRKLVESRKKPLEAMGTNLKTCFSFGQQCPYMKQCPAHRQKSQGGSDMGGFSAFRKAQTSNATPAAAASAPETKPSNALPADEKKELAQRAEAARADLEKVLSEPGTLTAKLAQEAADKLSANPGALAPLGQPTATVTPPQLQEEPLPAPEAKPKRGRPKKAAPAPEAPVGPALADTVEGVRAQVEEGRASPIAEDRRHLLDQPAPVGSTPEDEVCSTGAAPLRIVDVEQQLPRVFVNCLPSSHGDRRVVRFEDVVARAMERIAAKRGVKHYGFVQYEGRADLFEAVGDVLADALVLNTDLVVHGFTQEWEIVANAVCAAVRPDMVFRGIR